MERLTDCAQGYCEVYCDRYTSCFSEPDACERKYEVQLYERLKDYEGTGLEPEEIVVLRKMYRAYTEQLDGMSIQRFLDLVQAENEGRLVVLPCKAGDAVYELAHGYVEKAMVHRTESRVITSLYSFWESDIGKTAFLTREEAEAALAKGGNHES